VRLEYRGVVHAPIEFGHASIRTNRARGDPSDVLTLCVGDADIAAVAPFGGQYLDALVDTDPVILVLPADFPVQVNRRGPGRFGFALELKVVRVTGSQSAPKAGKAPPMRRARPRAPRPMRAVRRTLASLSFLAEATVAKIAAPVTNDTKRVQV
jgi:hypothetical protein